MKNLLKVFGVAIFLFVIISITWSLNIHISELNIFFWLSKILWFLFMPGNLILYLILFVFIIQRYYRNLGKKIFFFFVISILGITILPISTFFTQMLENRFEKPKSLPVKITGIVVLGGIINPKLTFARGEVQVNGAIERITMAVTLGKSYPESKIIFSGGSGSLVEQNYKEAYYAKKIFNEFGLSSKRVVFENESRNTLENAIYSKKIAQPNLGEHWLLITSAFHMPRAVGVFRQVNWNIVPYPVDFRTYPNSIGNWRFDFGAGLSSLNAIAHEYLGLLIYWLTGKSSEFIPSPQVQIELR